MQAPSQVLRRRGFTLVELLVVMIIVAILVALLLPVISGAMRTAKNGAVAAEFQTIGSSLEAFRAEYGEYPPSRVMLCEDGYWDTSDDTMVPVDGGSDITYGQLAQKSVTALRKFWPNLSIYTSSSPLPIFPFTGKGTWYDFNGNGILDASPAPGRGVILTGDECLCFFLGGVPLNTGTTGDPQISLSGFAKGKVVQVETGRMISNPFRNNLDNGNNAYWGDRTQPFHEFQARRLFDADGDGFPAYADQQVVDRPLAYFRAGNPGYDPNDVNIPEPPLAGAATSAVRAFRVPFLVARTKAAGNDTRLAISPGPNPYSSSAAHLKADGSDVATVAWHKQNSFQIISPGADGLFGLGGQYSPNGSVKLPAEAGKANTNDTSPAPRDPEVDNLANFAGGPLGQ